MNSKLKPLPPDFLSRLNRMFPPGQLHSILNSFLSSKPTTFRVNTIKTNADKVEKTLLQERVKFEKENDIPLCYYLKDISQKKIKNLSVYAKGEIYLQNFSSQIPPLLLDPQPFEKVLDLCASPGSKTTQMASLMKNQGAIYAIEPDKIRFERLNTNVKKMGCENVMTFLQRGETFCKNWPTESQDNLFDKILVDAPCAGEGTIYINDKGTYAHWTVDFVRRMALHQKKLLKAAVSVLKPGGTILYSTCSLSPEENEEVIQDTLNIYPTLKTINIAGLFSKEFIKPAFSSWNYAKFSPQIQNTARVHPSENREGFFLALLQK